MSDRDYFSQRAIAGRKAALSASSMRSFRAHMEMVRAYEHRLIKLARLAA
jgi:hypothetical protein